MTTFLSLFSGLEGASLAFEPLGWQALGFAELDPFCCALLAQRFGSNLPGEPHPSNGTPNLGDVTKIDLSSLPQVDVLVGGSPCQAFSVAGSRLSMADARGNLTLTYVAIAHELARSRGLRNAVWENVPGVLNTPDNAFGCFLGALVGHDGPIPAPVKRRWPSAGMASGPKARLAWRVLDAQYFGLAQRRKRVFVVVDFGNGADPAKVLFERKGMQGDSPPSREARKDVAPTISARTKGGGGLGTDFDCDEGLIAAPELARCVATREGSSQDYETTTMIAHTLRGDGFDASEDGTGRGTPIVPVVVHPLNLQVITRHEALGEATGFGMANAGEPAFTLSKSHSHGVALCFDARQSDVCVYGDMAAPLDTDGHSQAIAFSAKDYGADAMVECSPTLRAGGFTDSHANGGVMPAVAFAQNSPDEVRFQGGDGQIVGALAAEQGMKQTTYVAQAFDLRGREGGAQFEGPHDTANIRAASGGSSRSYVAAPFYIHGTPATEVASAADVHTPLRARIPGTFDNTTNTVIAHRWAVRRLTPTECERLQGVPDGHTRIAWRGKPVAECPDGPRYKALGNSWARPVVAWIGARIDAQLRLPTNVRHTQQLAAE